MTARSQHRRLFFAACNVVLCAVVGVTAVAGIVQGWPVGGVIVSIALFLILLAGVIVRLLTNRRLANRD